MGILNFVRTKYLALNGNWWTLWATYVFFTNDVYTYLITKKEYITVQLTSIVQRQ